MTGLSSELLKAVEDELVSAKQAWPEWPDHPLHAVAILTEEVGELTQAMLQMIYESKKSNHDKIRKEALQVAAMAFRILEGLPDYVYAKSIMQKAE